MNKIKSLVVDSQLLLLLVVGLGSLSDIQDTKRLSPQYSSRDFERLARFVRQFDTIATLPNILSEVSNFIGDSDMPRSKRARGVLKAIIEHSMEIYQPSNSVILQPEFEWLGVTDTAQLLLLEAGHTLLTNDSRLFAAALNRNLQAVTLAQIPE